MAKGKKQANRGGSGTGRAVRAGPTQSKKAKITTSVAARLKARRPVNDHQATSSLQSPSAMRSVRVFLEHSPAPNADPIEPILVDLFLSAEQRHCGQWFIFGWTGDPKDMQNNSYPFIIRHTGQIDFGCDLEGFERFGQTDLLKGEIRLGRAVQFDLADWGEFMYRITRIQDLSELAQQSGNLGHLSFDASSPD